MLQVFTEIMGTLDTGLTFRPDCTGLVIFLWEYLQKAVTWKWLDFQLLKLKQQSIWEKRKGQIGEREIREKWMEERDSDNLNLNK